MALGGLSFEAECGNFFQDIGKKARRETKRVLKQVENTGQKIGKEIVRAHDRLDGFVENEVVPVTESVIEDIKRFASEEVAPTLEQAGKDVGHAAEQSGKELKKAAVKTGKEIVRGHDRLDGFVEKAIDQAEDKIQKANDELTRFRKSAENKAMEHLREKSPTVRVITRMDDFINRYSGAIKFSAISASAVAALVSKYFQQPLDLQYFKKFSDFSDNQIDERPKIAREA